MILPADGWKTQAQIDAELAAAQRARRNARLRNAIQSIIHTTIRGAIVAANAPAGLIASFMEHNEAARRTYREMRRAARTMARFGEIFRLTRTPEPAHRRPDIRAAPVAARAFARRPSLRTRRRWPRPKMRGDRC